MTTKTEIEVQPNPTVPLRPHNSACNVKSRLSHIIMMLPRRGLDMLANVRVNQWRMKEPYKKVVANHLASSLALLPRGTQRSVDRG
jgi:hypothetical protein